VIEYCPSGVSPAAVTVKTGVAGGVSVLGLIRHAGKSLVDTLVVTAQLRDTDPKLLSPPRAIGAIAKPPASIAAGVNVPGVSVGAACA